MISVAQIVRSPVGGIRKHILSIIERADKNKFHFYLVTNESVVDGQYEEFVAQLPKNCEVISLNIKNLPGISDVFNLLRLYISFKSKNISVFHGHGAKGGIYARLLSSVLKGKSIYTPHGGSLHQMHGGVMNRVYSFIEKIMSLMTDLFVFESDYSYEMFKKYVSSSPRKAIVNKNGVDDSGFQPKKNLNDPFEISTFSSLRKIKGLDVAILAMNELKKRNIIFNFHIYGEGEEESALRALIEKYDLNEDVKIHGGVSAHMDLFRAADVVIQPSYFESFGYTLVEGMSVGTPVIGASVGGMKEIIQSGENGLLFEPGDACHLSEQLLKIYKDNELRLHLIEKGRETIKSQYSEKLMVNHLESIYSICHTGSLEAL